MLPLLNRQWRVLGTAIAVPVAFNVAAFPLVADPMNFYKQTLPYILLKTRDYFNSSIAGNGLYYGLPMWLIVLLRIIFALLAVASLWLLYRYYRTRDPLFWFVHLVGCAADRVVAGAVAGAGVLLDDAVPVLDDGGAAQLGDPQLAGVAGGLRVPVRRQVAAPVLAHAPAARWSTCASRGAGR